MTANASDTTIIDIEEINMLFDLTSIEDVAFFKGLVLDFLRDLGAAIEKMKAAYSERDYRVMGALAHKMKSSSGSMGAVRLYRIFQRIEADCKDQSLEPVEADVMALSEEAEAVRVEYKRLLTNTGQMVQSAGWRDINA